MTKKPSECSVCSYSKVGSGFVPDRCGKPYYDKTKGIWRIIPPKKILFAVLLEAPGYDEAQARYEADGYGIPLVGKSGRYFDYVLLKKAGLDRKDLLIGNVLHCRPPKNEYPKGKQRKEAEDACEQWRGELRGYNPTVVGLTFHPAAIFRSPQYERFVVKALEEAKKMALAGERVVLCMGDKASHLMLPFLKGGIKRFQRGFYETNNNKM